MDKPDPFKLNKYKNIESRFKSDTEEKVLQRRNTYEGFKAVAQSTLNIDPKSGVPQNAKKKVGVRSTRVKDNIAPIDYDLDDLGKKSPDELNKILKQMQDYNQRSQSEYNQLASKGKEDEFKLPAIGRKKESQ